MGVVLAAEGLPTALYAHRAASQRNLMWPLDRCGVRVVPGAGFEPMAAGREAPAGGVRSALRATV